MRSVSEICALITCRGAAEYPWKTPELARAAAKRAVACMHGTNWVQHLGAPVTAAELQQKLRAAYEPCAEKPSGVGGHSRPLLVSALRMKKVLDGSPDHPGPTESARMEAVRTTATLLPPVPPEDSDHSQDLTLSDASSVELSPRTSPTRAALSAPPARQIGSGVACPGGALGNKRAPAITAAAVGAKKPGGPPASALKSRASGFQPATTVPTKGAKPPPAKRAKKM
jgi:hypothetical protein